MKVIIQGSESRLLWNAVVVSPFWSFIHTFLLKNGDFSELSPFVLYAGFFSYLAVYMEQNKH